MEVQFHRIAARRDASPILLVAAILGSGCGDDCGPHGAPELGLVASNAVISLDFGDLNASENNDCTPTGSNVISVTIEGVQQNAAGTINFCIPEPQLLGKRSLVIGSDVVQLGINGMDATCAYTLDATQAVTGTIQASHVCGNGTDKAGFELTVSGALSLSRKCSGIIDTQAVTLSGTVAVTAK